MHWAWGVGPVQQAAAIGDGVVEEERIAFIPGACT